jgi:hypothetical protein
MGYPGKTEIFLLVRMYICMFPYSLRGAPPVCHRLGVLMPWNQENFLERSKLQKSVLGLSPGEDDFCKSETKNNRRPVIIKAVVKFICLQIIMAHAGSSDNFL